MDETTFGQVPDGAVFVWGGDRYVKRGEYARRENRRVLRPMPSLSEPVTMPGKGK